MGAWGTGILQNDTTGDILVEFKELYNKGLSLKEIRHKLEKEYKPKGDNEYYAEIWTGIAYGQWMCGDIEDYTLKKLKDATNLKWLTLWADDKKLLEKRIKAISDFNEKIKTPRQTTLKRKKIISRPVVYKKGDVIALKVDANSYLTAIVVKHDNDLIFGENTIVLTDLLFSEKPTQQQILNANILYLDIGGDYNYHRGFYEAMFSAKNMVRKTKDTIKIGKLAFKNYLGLGVGIGVGDWNKISKLYFDQIEFLKINKSDKPFNVKVKDLISPKQSLQDKLFEWSKKIFREKMKLHQQKAT